MAWRVEFSADAERDFELIFDHLLHAYIEFGEPVEVAFERAALRVERIRTTGEHLSKAPYRGTLRDNIAPGLRNVTIERAILWFELEEETSTLRILAVFFGGQDHVRHMLSRLLG
jgi:toxin ParE1/3/4